MVNRICFCCASRIGPLYRAEEAEVSCKSCQSSNQHRFPTEVKIHFPGLEHDDQPSVWAFPEFLICLDCGFCEFSLAETELQLLSNNDHLSAVTTVLSSKFETYDNVPPRVELEGHH